MLVNLTPNTEEIERCKKIAKEHNIKYIPQSDPIWLIETGIYQCCFGFNFHKEIFMESESMDKYDINEIFYAIL